MKFKVKDSETQYKGRVFSVRRDEVELPDGKTAHLDIVEHNPSVSLLPLDDQGRIWFVRQYRHPAGEELLELPAGVIEPGESPEACARREIREEIEMAAEKIEKLGEFYLAPGYSTEYMYAYLATGLKKDPLQRDEDEFLAVEKIPAQKALDMAAAGELKDVKSLAVLFLARPYLLSLEKD